MIIALFAVAALIVVWAFYAYRRDLRRLAVPPAVVDPADSASCGGFGPEWDDLIAATKTRRAAGESS
jgi:ligand-binding SRPBCC domain-containing protein